MYIPTPVDTSHVLLSDELLAMTEQIAENIHDVWAQARLQEGWRYGPVKDSIQKTTPCLVPYCQLPEEEKAYDRSTVLQTLKLVCKLGYRIEKET